MGRLGIQLSQLHTEVRSQEGGADQLLLYSHIFLTETEQIDPLLELPQTEDHQRLLHRLDLIAQGKVGRVHQFHQRECQGDISGDDLGNLIDIRLVLGNGDHQLEEVALHMVNPVDKGFFCVLPQRCPGRTDTAAPGPDPAIPEYPDDRQPLAY